MPIDSPKNNNNKMSINNYHNYHNSYFEKKKSYYIILSCALHGLSISFSNFQGNSIRNLKKKKKLSVLKFVNLILQPHQ